MTTDEEDVGYTLLSFKDEMRQMPRMQRWTIYASIACLFMLSIQCLLIMPVILWKYGWGYSVD
jgi:hypothetical protein